MYGVRRTLSEQTADKNKKKKGGWWNPNLKNGGGSERGIQQRVRELALPIYLVRAGFLGAWGWVLGIRKGKEQRVWG